MYRQDIQDIKKAYGKYWCFGEFKNKYRNIYETVSFRNAYIQLALDYRPISLGPGYPDYGPPDFVLNALSEVVHDENLMVHQYTRGYVRV